MEAAPTNRFEFITAMTSPLFSFRKRAPTRRQPARLPENISAYLLNRRSGAFLKGPAGRARRGVGIAQMPPAEPRHLIGWVGVASQRLPAAPRHLILRELYQRTGGPVVTHFPYFPNGERFFCFYRVVGVGPPKAKPRHLILKEGASPPLGGGAGRQLIWVMVPFRTMRRKSSLTASPVSVIVVVPEAPG